MAGRVRAWLGGGGQLRWLAFDDYARQVFARDNPGWFREPLRHVNGLADANKVLGSEVIEFNLGALCAVRRDLAIAATGSGRVNAVLGDAGVRAFCAEALAALVHGQAARADIMLALPSPASLLVALGEDAGTIDFDMLDDVATLLVGVMREHADAGLDGLVLTFTDTGVDAADELEASEAIKNAAAHYGWVFAARAASVELALNYQSVAPDLWLVPGQPVPRQLEGLAGFCSGLDVGFWRDGELATTGAGACLYGEVPADLDPKIIVQRISALPSR
ncbi:MAG: hypothetical protein ACSLE5_10180 [Porticoccaceae bacterium]